ncbi:MAG TPA: porin [Burkholderiales bacterium]|nr:porin [Burkholderiales bacterium]
MKLQKTHLAAAVGVALSAYGTFALAQTPPPMSVQLYGQVSRALMYADDGTQKKWFHVDNEASGTRLGATGTGTVMPGLRAGFRIEFDFQSNESQRVNFGPTSPISNFPAHDEDVGGFAERHADAWIEGAWGRLNIGQGDGAANGATESDLSGTGMANGIGVADLGGGFAHRTAAGALTAATVGGTINQQDFESRYDRLMYVTPNFAGFRGQVSWGQNANTDIKEASLWYGGKLGGLGEIAAAVGWSEQGAAAPGAAKDETIGGSISWLHGSGLNVTLSYSNRDNPVAAGAAGRDSTFTYAKVGWKFGTHAIAVDYAMGDDFLAVGDEAKMYGIGYVWNPIRWLELYAAYKIHELERSAANGGSLEDVTIGTIGTRVRF